MRKGFKSVVGFVLVLVLAMSLCGCGGGSKVSIDYGDAESFEAALNAGENLEGKVVRFTALELHPDSAAGYNVWAGEHLNFISSRNPDIKAGDTVVVRAGEITSSLGSWFIKYEKVDNAEVTDATISSGGASTENSESTETPATDTEAASESEGTGSSSSFAVGGGSSTAEKPLEITDYGWFMNEVSSYDDSAYIDFCTMIYNPNDSFIAEFPKAIVTVKNGDGSILATEEQTGSIIMPGDTITLCGMFSMPIADISDDAQIMFDVDWSDFTSGNSFYDAVKTTDFTFTNVSERSSSDENFITGEITNNSSIDLDTVNLSIVLRKDGKIVYMENTFVDGLKAGKTKAFEFQRYHNWPEHDTIECSAMTW